MMIRINEKGNKLLQDGYGHTIQVSTRIKPTDLSQAIDKLDHIMWYRVHHALEGINETIKKEIMLIGDFFFKQNIKICI
jgi:hypothetical protein